MSGRIVAFGSDSGLDIWGSSLSLIPGFETECVRDNSSDQRSSWLSVPDALREVRRAAKRADAVIAISSLLGACLAATRPGSPVVAIDVAAARVAATHRHLGPLSMTLMLRLPRLVVGVTTAHGAALAELRPRGIHVVRQPARPPACAWEPDRVDPYVLSVGGSGRDLGMLVDAARRLPFRVDIIEGGNELVPAPGTGLPVEHPPNVKHYGRVGRDAYLQLLSGASAVVLPLRYSAYPVGVTVLLDAMATGIPVVATEVPSVMEYQGEGTAFTVPVGDTRALTEALCIAVDDRDRAGRVAEAGQSHLAQISAPSVVAARFADVLRELA
jgi:glycosyltransferase involved in cell wall biosynthesis